MAEPETRAAEKIALRNSGLETLSGLAWGAHMCLFYATKVDLLATLVPYFAAGLDANECCYWVTSDVLTVEEATAALRGTVPDLERYFSTGQMTILQYTSFFLREGRFDRHEVLKKWQVALDCARNNCFAGVRASGDTSWLRKEDWAEFMQCEIDFERMFGDAPVLLICSYNTQKFDASDGQEVACHHDLVLTRTHARWEVARNAALGNKSKILFYGPPRWEKDWPYTKSSPMKRANQAISNFSLSILASNA